MRAGVVHSLGTTPVVGEFEDPAPDAEPATVVAAAMNPVDVAVVEGEMPFRRIDPPFVAGIEGVARLDDGAHRYFFSPRAPYGAYAERVPLRDAELTAAVPDGVDPVIAAALGTSGLAAYLALTATAELREGEDVAVLGADGQVGRVAVQVARTLGAGRIVAVVHRDDDAARRYDLGADAVVSSADIDSLGERLRSALPGGADVMVDLVWGSVIGPALQAAAQGARVVQVGNAAGAQATVSAPTLRNGLVRLSPHSNFLFSPEDRARAFGRLVALAAAGQVTVEAEQVGLEDTAAAYRLLVERRADRKLVIVP